MVHRRSLKYGTQSFILIRKTVIKEVKLQKKSEQRPGVSVWDT
jgi:hypothetical protein